MELIYETPHNRIKADQVTALQVTARSGLQIGLSDLKIAGVLADGTFSELRLSDFISLFFTTTVERYHASNPKARIEFLKALGATEWADGVFFIDPRKP